MMGFQNHPSLPLVLPRMSENIPFIAVLVVEDANGIQQTIKLIVDLELQTSKVTDGQKQVKTQTIIDSLSLVLPAPSIQGRPLPTLPKVPHLRAQKISVEIKPSGHPDEYDLLWSYPAEDFVVSKITNAKQVTLGAISNLALNPSLQFNFARKTGEIIERIPISQAIDLKNMCFGERNGAHFWDYPLTYAQAYSSAINLPQHRSTVKYAKTKPIDALHTGISTWFEINPAATPNRLSKSRRASERVISLGYKHVKMCFTIKVKKNPAKDFIDLQDQDREGSTVKLHHKFLSNKEKKVKLCKENNDNPMASASITLTCTK
jgi:hypothetical protein